MTSNADYEEARKVIQDYISSYISGIGNGPFMSGKAMYNYIIKVFGTNRVTIHPDLDRNDENAVIMMINTRGIGWDIVGMDVCADIDTD